jgi:hypothetical protein
LQVLPETCRLLCYCYILCIKLGAHWIGSAQNGTARLRSGERPRSASEPVGTRDPVSFHDTVGHDGKFIIYANYNSILNQDTSFIIADISSQALSLRKI